MFSGAAGPVLCPRNAAAFRRYSRVRTSASVPLSAVNWSVVLLLRGPSPTCSSVTDRDRKEWEPHNRMFEPDLYLDQILPKLQRL